MKVLFCHHYLPHDSTCRENPWIEFESLQDIKIFVKEKRGWPDLPEKDIYVRNEKSLVQVTINGIYYEYQRYLMVKVKEGKYVVGYIVYNADSKFIWRRSKTPTK